LYIARTVTVRLNKVRTASRVITTLLADKFVYKKNDNNENDDEVVTLT
jgi:hypothetical protein